MIGSTPDWQPTAQLRIGEVLTFYIPIHKKSWNNPEDILLPSKCASVLKFHTHLPAWHQLAIEQKSTTVGLIMYKHSTCTKLCHFAFEKTVEKLPNPWGNTRKFWTHPPLSLRKFWTHFLLSFPCLTTETKR